MNSRRVRSGLRKLSLQSLEKRQLMAAYINELMVDPLFGNGDGRQYIELRGEPNRAFDQGTYFAVISDRGIGEINPGVIHGLFDLSGQRFGSNGIMLILPQASFYPLSESLEDNELQPTILRSTEAGFGGLPGDIYSDLHPLSETIDFILGSNSYFLLQSDVAPTLAQDIDIDNDGLIDEESNATQWDVLDSVSLHHGVFTGSTAYGRTVYIEDNFPDKPNVVLTSPDAVIVRGGGFGYAARIGDSTGAAAEDWVFSTTRDAEPGSEIRYRLEDGIFGVPLPRVFLGRDLDHLGESNFIGGVRGKFTQSGVDDDGNEITTPVAGVKVLADENGNGRRDLIQYIADPDSFPLDSELTNVYTGATLSITGQDFGPTGFEVTSERETIFNDLGNRVFAHVGIGFLNSSRQLRIDFYRPARSVSVEAIGSNSITYGRLEAFNAKGESLGFVRSRALQNGSRQRISLSYGDDVIAYALAYSDENFQNSSPFGMIDGLQYTQMEAIAETDENGEYSLGRLYPNSYDIIAITGQDTRFATPLSPVPVTIERYENFRFDFDVTINTDPKVAPAVFTIPENPALGLLIGKVTASDPNVGQTVSYSLEQQEDSPVSIDAETGELFVANRDGFDFETSPKVIVSVIATDSVGGATRSEVVINLTDVNEAPTVNADRYSISEEVDNGVAFGRVNAFDPEDRDSELVFANVGGTGKDAFEVDTSTGVLRVKDASLLNFEANKAVTFIVSVSDKSAPPKTTQVTLEVLIEDANDAPAITSNTFEVAEKMEAGTNIGTVAVEDADAGQTHTFRIISGDENAIRIDSTTGKLFTTKPLDFETVSSYELLVQVVDNGAPPKATTKTVTVNVTNIDEPVTLNDSEFSLSEDANVGTLVGTLGAVDPDGQITARFRSSDPANPTKLFGGRVTLDPITGRLTVAPEADLDADGPNSVLDDKVMILDGDDLAGESAIKLILANVNEAPEIPPQRFGLPRGIPSGRVFAQIEFSDPEGHDVEIDVIGDSAAFFGVDNNRRLFVQPGVTIDFESKPEIEIDLEIKDELGLKSTTKAIVFQAPLPKFGTEIPKKTLDSGNDLLFTLPAAFRSANVKSLTLIAPESGMPAGLRFDPLLARLTGLAAPAVQGTFEFTVQVLEQDGNAEVLKQEKFSLEIKRSATPLLNVSNPLDVDGNSKVEPLDALRILNVIGRNQGNNRALELVNTTPFYVDPNGSNTVTSLDALLVINHIARQSQSSSSPVAAPAVAAEGLSDVDDEANDVALTELFTDPELF